MNKIFNKIKQILMKADFQTSVHCLNPQTFTSILINEVLVPLFEQHGFYVPKTFEL